MFSLCNGRSCLGSQMGQSEGCTLPWGSHGSSSVPTGKRICLGEGIARSELFLFFTTVLQNFSVASPVDPKDIDLTPKNSGVSRIPPRHEIHFLPRQMF